MVDADARRFLADQMQKFLANEDYEQPSGYVPPS